MTESSNSSASIGCSEVPETKNTILAITLIIICVVAFLGNSVVCATVYFHRSLHTVTNVLIVSLACADLFVSVLSMPLRIHYILHNNRLCLSISTCAFWIWTDCVACSASIGNLAAVSIERFIAIKYPLRYQSILTKRSGIKIIVFIWLYSLAWASLGNYNWTHREPETFRNCRKNDPYYYTFVSAFSFFLPSAVVVAAYSYLTKVAIQQRRALFGNVVVPKTREDGGSTNQLSRERGSRFLHELKATKMMAVVVGGFFLCWFPFFVLLIISLWDISVVSKDPVVNEFISTTFVHLLPNLNSSLNPVIYITFTRELRRAIFGTFGKIASRITRKGQPQKTKGNSLPSRDTPLQSMLAAVVDRHGFHKGNTNNKNTGRI